MLFKEVKSGRKPWEVRFNDRKFQVGDVLMLEEYLPSSGTYTGDFIYVEVTYIVEAGGVTGVKDGYVAMSIIPFTEEAFLSITEPTDSHGTNN